MAEVDLEKMECEMQDESHQLHQCVNATAAPTVGALRCCRYEPVALSCLGDIAHAGCTGKLLATRP